MTNDPRLTVILPTRNRKEGFRRVLESLLLEKSQHYPNLEIVVIDGRSTDGTMEVIREYEQDIVWQTQRSKGLYAALNEGLALATGDWVRMMSDDDEYVTGALAPIVAKMKEDPLAAGVGGTSHYERIQRDGRTITSDFGARTGTLTNCSVRHAPHFILFIHESMFFRREALVAEGGWDVRFKVAADVNLIFRLLQKGGTFYVLPTEILRVHRSPESLSTRHPFHNKAEVISVLLRTGQWQLLFRMAGKALRTSFCRTKN